MRIRDPFGPIMVFLSATSALLGVLLWILCHFIFKLPNNESILIGILTTMGSYIILYMDLPEE